MTTVLITAFEPYDRWKTNASWLALVQLTQNLPARPKVITRLYPVDFSTVKTRLSEDLSAGVDYALHLGQAPGSSRVQLEAIGINIGGLSDQSADQYRRCQRRRAGGVSQPAAAGRLGGETATAGVPAQVSYHAGTYLCNATLYWSCYLAERMSLKTKSTFVHLPLDVSQVVNEPHGAAALPAALSAAAIRLILEDLA